ncbi:MAG: ABC transporter permease subunit [Eubacteriaceae bacterium]|nr:ABC transporter permease subunit [Eubacteriaceae bacterium]
MDFFKQTATELRMLFYSRALTVLAALVILVSAGIPFMSKFTRSRMRTVYNNYAFMKSDFGSEEPIIVDGITVNPDNPMFYEIRYMKETIINIESGSIFTLSTEGSAKAAIEIAEERIGFFAQCAQHIKEYSYSTDVAYMSANLVAESYVLKSLLEGSASASDLEAAYMSIAYSHSFSRQFIELTPEEQQAKLDDINRRIADTLSYFQTKEIQKYVMVKKCIENDNIEMFKMQIADLEAEIIKNPIKEDDLSMQIQELAKQIAYINEINIPMLDFREKYSIEPNNDSWENAAIASFESNKAYIFYNEIIDREKFASQQYYTDQYKTYEAYVKAMQQMISDANINILISQRSLETGKPDLAFVTDGSRYMAFSFLQSSFVPTALSMMAGGFILANEFQSGTIRLLLIRPRSRTKILLSKYCSVLVFSILVFALACLVNMAANCLLFGFADMALPKYTPGGQQGFFAFYLPKALLCILPLLFSVSFVLIVSVFARNAALSIVVPMVFYIASFLVTQTLAFSPNNAWGWVKYTPIPYYNIASLFARAADTYTSYMSRQVYSIPMGIGILTATSAAFLAAAIIRFKRLDITN